MSDAQHRLIVRCKDQHTFSSSPIPEPISENRRRRIAWAARREQRAWKVA